MFLVDHNEAEVGEGQEQRRAGADDDIGAAFRDGAVSFAAHGGGEFGVPDRRGGAEAALEALQELYREGDFRQQHQGLLLLPQRLCHGFQIDFRFARAGDAVEQGDAKFLRRDRVAQRGRGGGLRGGKRGAGMRRVRAAKGIGFAALGVGGEQAFLQGQGQHVAALA